MGTYIPCVDGGESDHGVLVYFCGGGGCGRVGLAHGASGDDTLRDLHTLSVDGQKTERNGSEGA